MGTWGAGIFDDDFASDVRRDYLEKLTNGEEPQKASRALIKSYGADGKQVDEDEGPIFWLALAATQWEYGALDERVKKRALAIIDSGKDSSLWTEAGPDQKRAAVLDALGKKLRTPPPRAKRPRKRKDIDTHSRDVPSPDGSATATAFIIGNLAQVMISSGNGGGGVFAAECAHDAIQLRWVNDATLEISYPATARVVSDEPIGSRGEYFRPGRPIALHFKKRRG